MQELTGREAEQRVRRAQRGAERDELLAALEGLEWWYRDLVVVAAGADRLAALRSPDEVDVDGDRLPAFALRDLAGCVHAGLSVGVPRRTSRSASVTDER